MLVWITYVINCFLLGLKIQSVTHDSIEDARTALQLYHRYQEIELKGNLTATLKELYEVGERLQWKVPLSNDT
jgi:PAB-dependent poly(A)-specific ribonuclease subunit 2